jgi:hypothetical protein
MSLEIHVFLSGIVGTLRFSLFSQLIQIFSKFKCFIEYCLLFTEFDYFFAIIVTFSYSILALFAPLSVFTLLSSTSTLTLSFPKHNKLMTKLELH